MERLAACRLCIFNTNFLFLLRRSKVSCNFILKISKKFSAFKFSPKLWDKPAYNSLQFFTIPLGYLLGGALVDTVFEPFMAAQTPESLFCCLFGTGKGSGAAFLFLVLGFLGVAVFLCFRRSKLIRGLEANDKD